MGSQTPALDQQHAPVGEPTPAQITPPPGPATDAQHPAVPGPSQDRHDGA